MNMTIKQQLERPFPITRIHWRAGSTNAKKLGVKPWEATEGMALAYIDARDVMQRLDDVVGTEGWQCRYSHVADGLVICEIGLRFDDDWVWKANGAGDTQVEAEKGKLSDAMKRAAVLWGVGRYLYSLPTAWCKLKNGQVLDPPAVPDWATPEGYDEIIRKRNEASK